jgi:hypothetical protein
VLTQLACVEQREPLRQALVQCGHEVYEAACLGPGRELDDRRVLERWQELQRALHDPEAPPAPPIH